MHRQFTKAITKRRRTGGLSRTRTGGARGRGGRSGRRAFGTEYLFSRYNANEPTEEKADWLIGRLQEFPGETMGTFPSLNRTPVRRNVFRRDIFERVKEVQQSQARTLHAEGEDYTVTANGAG